MTQTNYIGICVGKWMKIFKTRRKTGFLIEYNNTFLLNKPGVMRAYLHKFIFILVFISSADEENCFALAVGSIGKLYVCEWIEWNWMLLLISSIAHLLFTNIFLFVVLFVLIVSKFRRQRSCHCAPDGWSSDGHRLERRYLNKKLGNIYMYIIENHSVKMLCKSKIYLDVGFPQR